MLLNNIILVVNQHGTILNNLLHLNKSSIPSAAVLEGLARLGATVPIDPQSLTYTQSEVDKSLSPLRERLLNGDKLTQEAEKRATESMDRVVKVEKDLTEIEKVRQEITQIKTSQDRTISKIKTEVEGLAEKIEGALVTAKQDLQTESIDIREKLTKFEKELCWKVDDCSELLKLRPTTANVDSQFQALESRLLKEFDDMLSQRQRGDGSTQAGGDDISNRSVTSFNEIYEKIHHFENQQETLKHQMQSGPSELLVDRLENMHLKVEDQQTMIHQTQKRVEELYEMIRNMDNRVLKISSSEQALSAKLDMVVETIEIMRDSRPRSNNDNNNSNNGDSPSGGGGMGIMERANMKRNQEQLEELTRLVNELDKDMKGLKPQLASLNSALTMIQNELTYKLDKETFDHGMDTKLDKDEFYSKFNEGAGSDELAKKLDSEIKKQSKKTDAMLEELKGKQKKLKKRVEQLEADQKGLEGRLEEQLDKGGEKNLGQTDNSNRVAQECVLMCVCTGVA